MRMIKEENEKKKGQVIEKTRSKKVTAYFLHDSFSERL
jgi:hypothetical protein